jgi:hypothetical protein
LLCIFILSAKQRPPRRIPAIVRTRFDGEPHASNYVRDVDENASLPARKLDWWPVGQFARNRIAVATIDTVATED